MCCVFEEPHLEVEGKKHKQYVHHFIIITIRISSIRLPFFSVKIHLSVVLSPTSCGIITMIIMVVHFVILPSYPHHQHGHFNVNIDVFVIHYHNFSSSWCGAGTACW